MLPNLTGENLAAAMRGEVDPERVILHTDKGKRYTVLGRGVKGHETVDHGQREYVRGDVTTNHAEGFFSQLKRSIDGTHHHVSVDHLHRYAAEFAFRYTYRKESDTARMQRIVSQTGGRRLMCREPAQGLS